MKNARNYRGIYIKTGLERGWKMPDGGARRGGSTHPFPLPARLSIAIEREAAAGAILAFRLPRQALDARIDTGNGNGALPSSSSPPRPSPASLSRGTSLEAESRANREIPTLRSSFISRSANPQNPATRGCGIAGPTRTDRSISQSTRAGLLKG